MTRFQKTIGTFIIFLPAFAALSHIAAKKYSEAHDAYTKTEKVFSSTYLNKFQIESSKIIENGENLSAYFDIVFGLPIAFLSAVAAIAIALIAVNIAERQDRREKETYLRSVEQDIHLNISNLVDKAQSVWSAARTNDQKIWHMHLEFERRILREKESFIFLLFGLDDKELSVSDILEHGAHYLAILGIIPNVDTTDFIYKFDYKRPIKSIAGDMPKLTPKEETEVYSKLQSLREKIQKHKRLIVKTRLVGPTDLSFDENDFYSHPTWPDDEFSNMSKFRKNYILRNLLQHFNDLKRSEEFYNKTNVRISELSLSSIDYKLISQTIELICDTENISDLNFFGHSIKLKQSERNHAPGAIRLKREQNILTLLKLIFILKAIQDTGFDPIEGTDKKDKNKDNIHHLAKKYWSAVATDPFFSTTNPSEKIVNRLSDTIQKYHRMIICGDRIISQESKFESISPAPLKDILLQSPRDLLNTVESDLVAMATEISVKFEDSLHRELHLKSIIEAGRHLLPELYAVNKLDSWLDLIKPRINDYISFVEALGDQTLPTNDGKLAKAFLNVALDTIDEHEAEEMGINKPNSDIYSSIAAKIYEYPRIQTDEKINQTLTKLLMYQVNDWLWQNEWKTISLPSRSTKYITQMLYDKDAFEPDVINSFVPRGFHLTALHYASLVVHNLSAEQDKDFDFGYARMLETFMYVVSRNATPSVFFDHPKIRDLLLKNCSITKSDTEELQIFNRLWKY